MDVHNQHFLQTPLMLAAMRSVPIFENLDFAPNSAQKKFWVLLRRQRYACIGSSNIVEQHFLQTPLMLAAMRSVPTFVYIYIYIYTYLYIHL